MAPLRLRRETALAALGLLVALAGGGVTLVPGEVAWNFAFGSNMDAGTRARRRLDVKGYAPARARGWEVCFSLQGVPYLEPAFAALRRAERPGVEAHGVCLQLGREDWLKLLASEGVRLSADLAEAPLEAVLKAAAAKPPGGFGYRLLPVEVEFYDSSRGTAYALADSSDGPVPHLPPSQRYWRLLKNGARRHNLERSYRDYLSSLPRYVPSPLAPAALPTLATNAVATAASAVARMGQRIDAPEAWPALSGPAAMAQGRLEVGPVFRANSAWSRFCSTPREVVLQEMQELLGKEAVFI
ncbi:unnamed protein product [Effrenium voratum]|nr:unnamed protein product [Effrenium voratum]CAJ1423256.1 unnamed protein product [Effrenium voratum]